MLSSANITNMIATPATAMNQGKAAFHRQQGKRPGNMHTPKQNAFLHDFKNLPIPQRREYAHPERMPTGAKRGDTPLSPVELAWLQRLPQDPTQVPFRDAQTLAGLSQAIRPSTNPADARFVASVWEPVKDIHDRAESAVRAENAAQPLPPIPSSALGALADAIMHETPDLTPGEALARASAVISEAQTTRQAAQQKAVDAAENQKMEISARHYNRTVTTP